MNTENNNMDNGLDLLNKVIKSNEDNIEKLASTVSIYQDILNLVGEFKSSSSSLKIFLKKLKVLQNLFLIILKQIYLKIHFQD